MPKIVIEVRGNVVQEVYATPDTEIVVVDHDKELEKQMCDLSRYRGVIKKGEGMVKLLSTVQQ